MSTTKCSPGQQKANGWQCDPPLLELSDFWCSVANYAGTCVAKHTDVV